MGGDFHFAFIKGAWILFFIPIFGFLFFSLREYRKNRIRIFSTDSPWPHLIKRSERKFWFQGLAYSGAWLFATLAFMQPQGMGYYPEEDRQSEKKRLETLRASHQISSEQQHPNDVIFLLDASASMLSIDTRSQVSRFDSAKNIIEQIVSKLNGQTVSLYAFTSQVIPLVPPTLDYFFLRMMLQEVSINEGDTGGTDFQVLLEFCKKNFIHPSKGKSQSIVLLSDGGDTLLESLKGKDKASRQEEILQNLSQAKSAQVHFFCIGMGSVGGADIPGLNFEGHVVHSALESTFLQKLSLEGGGKYYEANDDNPLKLAQDVVDAMDNKSQPLEVQITSSQRDKNAILDKGPFIFRLFYQIPLGVAILLLTYALVVTTHDDKKHV